MKKKLHIALVAGSWSSNIGNAFFNLGAEWLLKDIGLDVSFLPENPRWKSPVQDDFDPIKDIDVDLVVLAGPCLWPRLGDVYRATFDRLYERGVKVGYLTAGMGSYSDDEARWVGEFLERYPPAFISTRDRLCYELLAKRVNCPIYSGLCTSMFLNDALVPLKLSRAPYCVYNFDETEPELECNADGGMFVVKKKCKRPPRALNGLDIVRTNNLSIDAGYSNIYQRPNSYHSDMPQGYCSILANAEVVFSERVHTCATALIYGRKAQFITVSRRSHERRSLLFERIGAKTIFDTPTELDLDYVEQEKAKMREFLLNSVVRGCS